MAGTIALGNEAGFNSVSHESHQQPGSDLLPSDHPIFSESIRRIRLLLAEQAALDADLAHCLAELAPLEREVLERCIHSSGDPAITAQLRFSRGACRAGLMALTAGAPILTDTAMAAAAVLPMAQRSFRNRVASVLDWAPPQAPPGSTRAAAGMALALAELSQPVVLIGSAPTALELLLERVAAGLVPSPALVIGMPVGFVGVAESKRHLAASGLPQIRLEGSRGGAGLAAAACNALLRRGWLEQDRGLMT